MNNFNIIKDFWVKDENILYLFLTNNMSLFLDEKKKNKIVQLILTEIYYSIIEKRSDIKFFRMITSLNDFNLFISILNDLSNNNLLHFFGYKDYDYIIRFMKKLDNESKNKIIELYKNNILERDKYFVSFIEKLLIIENEIKPKENEIINVDNTKDDTIHLKMKSLVKMKNDDVLRLFKEYNELEDISKKKLTQNFLKRWNIIDRLSELITLYEWYSKWEYKSIFIDNIDFIGKEFFKQTGKDLFTYKKLLKFFLRIYVINWDKQYLNNLFFLSDEEIKNDVLINLFLSEILYLFEDEKKVEMKESIYKLINVNDDLYSNISIDEGNDDFLIFKRDFFVNSKYNYHLILLSLSGCFYGNNENNKILLNLEKTLINIWKNKEWLIWNLEYISWWINWWYSTILDFLILHINYNSDFSVPSFMYTKFLYRSDSILQEKKDLYEVNIVKLEKFLNSIAFELNFDIIKNYISELIKIDKNKFPNYYNFLEIIIRKYYPDFFNFFEE